MTTSVPEDLPDVIARYFEADASRDTDTIVSLFTDDPQVVDEGETRRGVDAIRAWRETTASRYRYTTEVLGSERTGENEYLLSGRLEGNFPGGTADLTWRFILAGGRIRRLHIA